MSVFDFHSIARQARWCFPGVLILAGQASGGASGPESPPNLAAVANGAKITASSEVGRLRGKDHTAGAVIDGRTSEGYWCPAFGSKPPHWLELDLGGPKRFNQVLLQLYGGTVVKSCRIEQWEGNAWVPVAEMSSTPSAVAKSAPEWQFSQACAGILRCDFPAVTSSRVRLWFAKDSSVRLHEVQVRESRPAGPAAPPRLDGKAPLIRIAFGQREGTPGADWLTLPAATRFAPGQGLGWVGEGRRTDCDRWGGPPFARGFVAGWASPGRLRLDLPAGRYVAALFASDFALPMRPFRLEVSGDAVGPELVTASRGAWEARRFRFQAGADGVELTFRGSGAWLVNALVIAPESNLNGLLNEADRLEEQLALGSPEWLERRKLVAQPEPVESQASAADLARGYVFFTPELMERIDPWSRPRKEQIGQRLQIDATPGEAAAAVLGVAPLRPLFDMRLSCTDLRAGSQRIPAPDVEIRLVHCWPQIDKTPAGRGKVEVVPELLTRQDRQPAVCAPAGSTRRYWITVRVPGNAQPGQYQGELQFSADAVAPATVPIALTVLPFRLETPPGKTFFMYSIFGDFSDDEITAALRDMRAHGMNSLASDLAGSWSLASGGKPGFDVEPLRRILRLAKREGFTRPMPWHAAGLLKGIAAEEGSPEWNRALGDLLQRVRQVQDEVGGQELLFYPVDEPFGNDQRLTLAERAMRVARETGALRTYCTPAEKDIARLGSLLDVRCYAIGTVTSVREAAASSREANASFWWYTNAARELPEVRRFLAGVWFWSTGADGQGYWVYQSRWRASRPFQDLEGDLHAHDYAAYPDVGGPVSTIQWECIRLGIDDARYLHTLEAAIQARPGSPAAPAAEAFLAELRKAMPDSVNLPDKTQILYRCPWQAGQFSQLRREVARHIQALRQ